jgi:hypothetical protein
MNITENTYDTCSRKSFRLCISENLLRCHLIFYNLSKYEHCIKTLRYVVFTKNPVLNFSKIRLQKYESMMNLEVDWCAHWSGLDSLQKDLRQYFNSQRSDLKLTTFIV